MKKKKLIYLLNSLAFVFLTLLSACKEKQKEIETSTEETQLVSEDLKWSERMLLSEMHRFPEAWMLDFHDKPKWSYPNGLVLNAARRVYEETGNEKYYDYIYKKRFFFRHKFY